MHQCECKGSTTGQKWPQTQLNMPYLRIKLESHRMGGSTGSSKVIRGLKTMLGRRVVANQV